ncbi:MAG: addiction module protein [Planctomycetes bacterium]|nr:addiction module protein [Planctomycetota bacterium]
MSDTAEQLKAVLAQLPASERAALAQYLIHSLDEGADLDAETAWDAELARRLAEIRSGQALGEPAERVLAELREKYT